VLGVVVPDLHASMDVLQELLDVLHHDLRQL
jgi:hypothetical protein